MSEEFIDNVISLSDEDGTEHQFQLVDAVETDDARYVALVSIPQHDEDEELLLLKVLEEDGEEILTAIEEDEEFNEILEIFEERLSDVFDIEEE